MSKISNFFHRFLTHNHTSQIVTYGTFFKMPRREDFSSHELELLEKYKEQYQKVLVQDKIIVSQELDFTLLGEEIKMNSDLLLHDSLQSDFQKSLQRSPESSDSAQTIKLGLYYEQICLLERKAEILYVALQELYEKKRFLLRPSKRLAIQNGIDNLRNSIILFQSQIRVIQIKIGTSLQVVETSRSFNEQEREDVFRIAQEVLPKKYQEIISQKKSKERMMAECIRELEIYVYGHTEDVTKLEEELNELYGKMDTENPIFLKESIGKLECYFLAFAKYGRNIVDEEFMENFYRVKFDIMTMDIIEQGEREIKLNTNKFEQKVYEDIIFEKIEQIRNSALDPEKITTILEFLKHDDRFDAIHILTSSLHLAFLLTVLDAEKYQKFLDNFMMRDTWIYYSTRYYNSHLFQWSNEAPLRTLIDTFGETLYRNRMLFLNDIYLIPPLIYPKEEDNIFSLPEGLVEFHVFQDLEEHEKNSLKKMYQKMENKDVYLPESLKVFDINSTPLILMMFGKVGKGESRVIFPNIRSLHLNQSLERCSINVGEVDRQIDELHIPSTLKAFQSDGSFEMCRGIQIQEMYIEDFEHVEELLSSESFLNFLEHQFIVTVGKDVEVTKKLLLVRIHLKKLVFVIENGASIYMSREEFYEAEVMLRDLIYSSYSQNNEQLNSRKLYPVTHFGKLLFYALEVYNSEVAAYFKFLIEKAKEIIRKREEFVTRNEESKLIKKYGFKNLSFPEEQ